MPIKICAIEPAGQQYGSELALLDILTGLDGSRFAAEVVVPKDCSFKTRLMGFNISALEFLRMDLSTGRNIFRPVSYARIILHWLLNSPDVVLVNQAGILRGTAFCNLLFRRPIICFVSTLEDAEHAGKLPAWVYKFVHKIICNSHYTAARLAGRPEKKQVVYCGYSPKNLFSPRPAWDPDNRDHKFVIGIVGRVCKSKGHDLLMRTLKLMVEKKSKWIKKLGIVFVGGYQQQEKDEMMELISRSPVSVEVTGYRANIAPELGRLHLLLIPSVAEPFGRVVQEAAEAGLPVIASNTGGLGEICALYEYGALFKYPDIAELAKLIEQAMENYPAAVADSLKKRESFLAEFSCVKIMKDIEKNLSDACRYKQ